jgi:hypothetical protein
LSKQQLPVVTELSLDPDELRVQLNMLEIKPREMYVIKPGVSRHYTIGVVLRYMVMYDDGKDRGFVNARQGRYTYPSIKAASELLNGMLTNNSADKLALYGGVKALFVAFVACYGGHYDSAAIDLGSSPAQPASFTDLRSIRDLAHAIARVRRDVEEEENDHRKETRQSLRR